MRKLGHVITGKEIEDIMNKHDFKKDGYLTYDEFRQIFFNL